MLTKKLDSGIIVFIVVIALILLTSITFVVIQNSNKRTILLTVTDKTVKNDGDAGKYLVYCEDKDGTVEVLEITDTLIWFRFNSSDEYARIAVGNTYEFTIVGKRISFLSMYPNILSSKEE